MMAEPVRSATSTPTCKRCGRFLRTEEERRREYCSRCPLPPPTRPPDENDRFCCGSDPPCPSCPYVVGWDD
jgi:hypothetical protein